MEKKIVAGAVASTKTTNQDDLDVLLASGQGRLVSVEECPAIPLQVQTKQQMLDRVKLLSDEIDGNEEENRMMQDEINSLYAKIDALKA